MRGATAKSLPVIMYHYVNDCPGGTSVSPDCFEDHCRTAAEQGWRGVSLAEAEAFLIDGAPLPAKSALFTFDDGYLDNCLLALPLLRQYGHCGVMFAVADRLEPEGAVRTLDKGPLEERVRNPLRVNTQGHLIREDVFCNHAEAKAMDAEGVLSVASHGLGHTGVYTGPEFMDFTRPGEQKRTFYRTNAPFLWGMPAFPVGAGLSHRAFIPDPALVEAITAFVPQAYADAAAFFADDANVEELKALVKRFGAVPGRFETDAERDERMWQEIGGGKKLLENIVGHQVRTLCWPWGAYDERALALAREAGFAAFITVKEGVNPPGNPLAVHRFKGKAKGGGWLVSRLGLYSRPLLGGLYARLRI